MIVNRNVVANKQQPTESQKNTKYQNVNKRGPSFYV